MPVEPINILITSHNRLEYLKLCIESLEQQTHPYILNIWDNGSDKDVKDWISKYMTDKNGMFLNSRTNVGTAEARNLGMKKIKSNIILLSDDDMWYEKHYIEYMMTVWNTMLKFEKKLAVLSNYNPFIKSYYRKKIFKSAVSICDGKFGIHYVSGMPPGSWLVDKTIIQRMGGFWLSRNKKMGFSAFKLSRRLLTGGFKRIRLASVNKRAYPGAQHMDNIKHEKCLKSLYDKTGYNAFRADQKASSWQKMKDRGIVK